MDPLGKALEALKALPWMAEEELNEVIGCFETVRAASAEFQPSPAPRKGGLVRENSLLSSYVNKVDTRSRSTRGHLELQCGDKEIIGVPEKLYRLFLKEYSQKLWVSFLSSGFLLTSTFCSCFCFKKARDSGAVCIRRNGCFGCCAPRPWRSDSVQTRAPENSWRIFRVPALMLGKARQGLCV